MGGGGGIGRAGGEYGATSPQGEAPTHPDGHKIFEYYKEKHLQKSVTNIAKSSTNTCIPMNENV